MAESLAVNIEDSDRYQLPAEGEDQEGGVPDLPGILRRIKEVARVLDNFKDLRDPARPRSDYMEQVQMTFYVWVSCNVHLVRVAIKAAVSCGLFCFVKVIDAGNGENANLSRQMH